MALMEMLRRRRPAARPDAPTTDDYGLLRAVALVDDEATARSVRALLANGRVRTTTAVGGDGTVRVLVFPEEYDRARRLISWVL